MPKKIKEEGVWDEMGWTKSKFFTFLRSGLRSKWAKFPNKYAVMKEASCPNDGKFNSKARTVYQCAECKNHYPATWTYKKKARRMVCVDHIAPAGKFTDYSDAEEFLKNLYCSKDNLQVLCDYTKDMFEEMGKPSCHYTKTQAERKAKKK